MVSRVGDEQRRLERDCLGGESKVGGYGRRRYVRAVAAVQRALCLMGCDEFADDPVERARLPLARGLRDDVTLRIDQDEGGPGAHRVLAPQAEIGVVEHGVADLVAVDGGGHRGVVGLVRELRRVHAHDDQNVAVLLLEWTQFVQDVQAIGAAEGPEVEQHNFAAQLSQRQRLRRIRAIRLGLSTPAHGRESAMSSQGNTTRPGYGLFRSCPVASWR